MEVVLLILVAGVLLWWALQVHMKLMIADKMLRSMHERLEALEGQKGEKSARFRSENDGPHSLG